MEDLMSNADQTASVQIALEPTELVFGIKGIDVMLGDTAIASAMMGDTFEVAVPTGEHDLHLLLHGVVDRKSNPVGLALTPGETVQLAGRYDRGSGTITLKLVDPSAAGQLKPHRG
jgi:hypothetical protein